MNDQKNWYIHTMEYSSNKKENTIDIFCKTQMNLKGIMLSEKRHSKKDTYYT